MCIVGPGGTGKSYFIGCIRDYCEQIVGVGCGITATTGIAASNIAGGTIFSYLGLNLQFKKKIGRGERRWVELAKSEVLIIDEFSMLEN